MPLSEQTSRPVALVTGVGRRAGIGAAVARRLAGECWDIATSQWAPYDDRMPWGRDRYEPDLIEIPDARVVAIPADLEDVTAPARLIEVAEALRHPQTYRNRWSWGSHQSVVRLEETASGFRPHLGPAQGAPELARRRSCCRACAVALTGRVVGYSTGIRPVTSCNRRIACSCTAGMRPPQQTTETKLPHGHQGALSGDGPVRAAWPHAITSPRTQRRNIRQAVSDIRS
jgi:hypothetical protein